MVVLGPEGLQKTYFDFSNNVFPLGHVTINFIIKLSLYMERLAL